MKILFLGFISFFFLFSINAETDFISVNLPNSDDPLVPSECKNSKKKSILLIPDCVHRLFSSQLSDNKKKVFKKRFLSVFSEIDKQEIQNVDVCMRYKDSKGSTIFFVDEHRNINFESDLNFYLKKVTQLPSIFHNYCEDKIKMEVDEDCNSRYQMNLKLQKKKEKSISCMIDKLKNKEYAGHSYALFRGSLAQNREDSIKKVVENSDHICDHDFKDIIVDDNPLDATEASVFIKKYFSNKLFCDGDTIKFLPADKDLICKFLDVLPKFKGPERTSKASSEDLKGVLKEMPDLCRKNNDKRDWQQEQDYLGAQHKKLLTFLKRDKSIICENKN